MFFRRKSVLSQVFARVAEGFSEVSTQACTIFDLSTIKRGAGCCLIFRPLEAHPAPALTRVSLQQASTLEKSHLDLFLNQLTVEKRIRDMTHVWIMTLEQISAAFDTAQDFLDDANPTRHIKACGWASPTLSILKTRLTVADLPAKQSKPPHRRKVAEVEGS